jgi:hypothetical protein
MHFLFEPHVPGEFGEQSIIDHRFEPFKVYHLHMVFDFTPDDFCQSFPVYFISEKMLNDFIDQKITGFSNPRLITHEQNEQSPISINDTKYFMIDISSYELDDIKIIDNKLFINKKVQEIIKKYNIRFGAFTEIENK